MDKDNKPCFNTKGFISQVFFTNDRDYAFQKVGKIWNLYSEENNWYFLKEFASFHSLCDYIENERNKYAKTEKRIVR